MPAITIVPGKGDEFVVQIEPFEERRLGEMNDAATRAMIAACHGRPIGWGNLSYQGNVTSNPSTPTGVIDYSQTFRCLNLDPLRYPHSPVGWKAAAGDEEAASKAFVAYFNAVDSGALVQAFAMFEPTSGGTREQWMSDQQIVRPLLKGKGERTITGLQWFSDPPQAPYPGIFARFTFAAKFAGVPVYCGSMVLYRAALDSYLVAGVREHVLPDEDKPSSQRIAEYQTQFCE